MTPERLTPNPWLARTRFHWAHQGGAKAAPSNTIHAMRLARWVGAQGLEFDVHLTNDGHLVLAHDDDLGRLTDCSGKIADLALRHVTSCNAAYRWVSGFVDKPEADESEYTLREQGWTDPELHVPTLDQVLDLFGDLPMTIEIKAPAAVEKVVQVLHAHEIPSDQVILASFDPRVVDRLLASGYGVAPGWKWASMFAIRVLCRLPLPPVPYVALQVPYHLGVENLPPRWRRVGRRLPPCLRQVRVLWPGLVSAAHDCGMAVHVWTIDDEAEMKVLFDKFKVDGIMTDCPKTLARVLNETS